MSCTNLWQFFLSKIRTYRNVNIGFSTSSASTCCSGPSLFKVFRVGWFGLERDISCDFLQLPWHGILQLRRDWNATLNKINLPQQARREHSSNYSFSSGFGTTEGLAPVRQRLRYVNKLCMFSAEGDVLVLVLILQGTMFLYFSNAPESKVVFSKMKSTRPRSHRR